MICASRSAVEVRFDVVVLTMNPLNRRQEVCLFALAALEEQRCYACMQLRVLPLTAALELCASRPMRCELDWRSGY